MLIVAWQAKPVVEHSREEWLLLWGWVIIDGVWLSPKEVEEALKS